MSHSWVQLDQRFPASGLGFLWDILLPTDKRAVKDQLEDRYRHGGGYRPFGDKHFRLDRMTMTLRFPGDPPFKPAAMALFGTEQVYFYPNGSLLLILQPDDTWEVTRVD